MPDLSNTEDKLELYKVSLPTTLKHQNSKFCPWVSTLAKHLQLTHTINQKLTVCLTQTMKKQFHFRNQPFDNKLLSYYKQPT